MNDTLFNYLDNFCIAYLDNIIIYSEDLLEHKGYVHKVLEQLCAIRLQANIRKSEFHV
jgi:hypothetical protein